MGQRPRSPIREGVRVWAWWRGVRRVPGAGEQNVKKLEVPGVISAGFRCLLQNSGFGKGGHL